VVMGSKQKRDNFQGAANLLTESFAMYRMLEPVKKGQKLPQQIPVQGAEVDTVPVVAGSTGAVLTRRGEDGGISTEIQSTNATAPIRQGQQVGWILVKQQGRLVSKVPALAAVNADEAPWYKKLFSRLWPF
jgi:D-alanyl-D-alanine carboxypeptidase (penicillin-binding protein 5/6)